MIAWNTWLLFLGFTVPMVFSPGPGNTLLATAGARFGIRGTLPFWAGFEAANIALCLLYGLGLGGALQGHPGFELALKWAGIAYLVYLGWNFIRSATPAEGAQTAAPTGLRFSDGFLAVALNPKIHSTIAVMFSQFLDPGRSSGSQVTQFTLAFLAVGILCHFPWVYGGQVILGRFRSARATRIQGWCFGICMLLVAAWLALS
ncbi:LysE family translocator [Bosea sp. (in: a-proteobacteria)]|uniref:LysE family translocator n=1 Tax=Bosea sp. (in: a-proteobacteria) TaxID=1871050 RepID=UPI002FCA1620